jgi:hypothetical protein
MKKYYFLLTVLLLTFYQSYSQKYADISKGNSCENAIEISTTETFGPTTAPQSIEDDTEMFAKTQNVVWYEFEIEEDGVLLFDIIPIDSLDNYDFVLYKGKGEGFCTDIQSKEKKSVRSNFYRNDMTKKGMTGLSIAGDGKSYSEGIDVKKGDSYYLMLNNTYENGSGHTLNFRYLKTFTVKGNISDLQTGEPVSNAILSWENIRDDEEIFTATTDKKGDYELKLTINVETYSFPRYYFYAYSDAYFISDTIILSKEIPIIESKKYDFSLKKITVGYDYEELPPIYFEPNESDMVAGTDKILKDLFLLLSLNSNLNIRIEGHTNGFYPSTSVDEMLSENRAKEIRMYFTEKGISEDRITVKGLGSTKMIYPTPEDEDQEGFNRRVEFYIVKF